MMKSLVALLVVCSLTGYAQDTVRYVPRFMTGGFGAFSTADDIGGFTYSMTYSKLNNSNLSRYRFTSYGEFIPMDVSPLEKYHAFSYMIGKLVGGKAKSFISVGPGLMFGVQRGDFKYSSGWFFSTDYYEKERFLTPIASIEAGFMIVPKGAFGLGFNVYADCGMHVQTIGGSLMIVFGKF